MMTISFVQGLPVDNVQGQAVFFGADSPGGRASVSIFLDQFQIAAAAETLLTMSRSRNFAAPTTGTSYQVTTGTALKIQSINLGLVTTAGNTTIAGAVVKMRVNPAGAATIASPVQRVFTLKGSAAPNDTDDGVSFAIGDGGILLPSGAGVAFTVTCPGYVVTTAAPLLVISASGYEA